MSTHLDKDSAEGSVATPSSTATGQPDGREPPDDGFARLPRYTRSMLHVQVPVRVNLAAKKLPIGRIVELGPGSIITFDKSCDEMLELEVGGCTIAEGEAVKVGDKFGLRIHSIVLPHERFRQLRPRETRQG